MVYSEITWIFACAVPVSFFVAYGIGANDVANAFGSSVGSKALTIKQAILVAAVFEFCGAVFMGSGVTSTIRSGVANLKSFTNTPDLLAYGQLCAMMASGIWLLVATFWELPVSTTHSIVGAVIGMAMVTAGPDAVIWSQSSSTFPYFKGVAAICTSWVVSPVVAGTFSIIVFFSVRLIVLRAKNAYQRSLYMLPVLSGVTFFVVTYFIMVKGGPSLGWDDIPDGKKAWISAIVAGGMIALSIWPGIPFLKSRVERDMKLEEDAKAAELEAATKATEGGSEKNEDASSDPSDPSDAQEGWAKRTPQFMQTFRKSRFWKSATAGMDVDIHDVVETQQDIHDIHANSEKFDYKAEKSFKYLQVCTACANAFAHGSNDVANAIGPFAAIYQIWQDSAVSSSASVPEWILVVGGIGIVVGLATYGYKIMRVLGVKMTKMTNSRGFTVELCAAAVVILGSRFNLPLSTTQTLVGAVMGIGILERTAAFNWRILIKFFAGWVATLVVAGLTSAAFAAQGIYAPNRTASNQRADVGFYLNGTATSLAALLNSTGVATGNQTLVQQAQSIIALASSVAGPIVSLMPPTEVQGVALAYTTNASVWNVN